jgi:hypothetical protein
LDLFYDRLVYFVAIWYILGLCVWYIFPRFGMLYQEKSGNPGLDACFHKKKGSPLVFVQGNTLYRKGPLYFWKQYGQFILICGRTNARFFQR